MRENHFQNALDEGRIPVGHMVMEFGTRGVARLVDAAGVDFAVYDMEHSGFSLDRVADLLAWTHGCRFTPFVRVPQRLYHFLARVLDAGAMGVMVANVENAAQAKEIVQCVKYPPVGRRGVALGIAHTDYILPSPPGRYFEEANEKTTVICQIESVEGVKNARSIAAVDGVDCLWVGHYDLTTSMGIPGSFRSDRFLEALDTVVAAARECGISAGIQPGGLEQAEQWLAHGFNVISYGADLGLYGAALHSGVERLRLKIETRGKKD